MFRGVEYVVEEYIQTTKEKARQQQKELLTLTIDLLNRFLPQVFFLQA